MTKGWLNEFSQMGLEILRETSLNAHIKSMKKRQKSMTGGNNSSSPRSRAPSLNTIHDYIEERKDQLAGADSIEFNTI